MDLRKQIEQHIKILRQTTDQVALKREMANSAEPQIRPSIALQARRQFNGSQAHLPENPGYARKLVTV